MQKIQLSPDEIDVIVNNVAQKALINVTAFMKCTCKKWKSKNCPKHQYITVRDNIIKASYLRIGDKLLNDQNNKRQPLELSGTTGTITPIDHASKTITNP
jgi:hypothetical protein